MPLDDRMRSMDVMSWEADAKRDERTGATPLRASCAKPVVIQPRFRQTSNRISQSSTRAHGRPKGAEFGAIVVTPLIFLKDAPVFSVSPRPFPRVRFYLRIEKDRVGCHLSRAA